MLHAAAMLIGLSLLGLIVLGRGATPEAFAIAAGAALLCVVFAARFGGLGRSGFSAPQVLLLAMNRSSSVVAGALATVRAAVAADVTLNPALVRVRTRASGAFTKAMLADLMSAAPGTVVVEADVDSALIHVNDEDGVDAADIGALEARVIGALEARGQA